MAFTADAVKIEMQGHVKSVASIASDRGRKEALSFAARVLGLSYARVKSLFYGEARRVEAHEADQIRAYVEAAHKLIEARAKYEADRAAFLATAHPALVRLAPPALEGSAVQEGGAKAGTMKR